MRKRILSLSLIAAALLLLAAGVVWTRHRRFAAIPPESGINPARLDAPYETADGLPPEFRTVERWPAEFEEQQAIWLQWPSEIYGEKEPITPAFVEVIRALDPYVRVNIAARSDDEIEHIKTLMKNAGDAGTNAHFYLFDHFSIWARDVGPVFVRDTSGALAVVDFSFNNYSREGSASYIETERNLHRLIAGQFNYPLIQTSLVSEGGAIESNGAGTMMTTESVAFKRNPGMTHQQIEHEYKRVLGVRNVIWLKSGLAEDDAITSGHINEFCRFANPTTILLAQVPPGEKDASALSRETDRRMEENYEILRQSTDQDGKPFAIIRVPLPPTLYNETDTSGKPVRSYLNYAVTNGAVLMQTYWRPGRSEALKEAEDGVKELLKGVFPAREVIGIDAESVNMWGGGIHCITQHVPRE